MKRLLTSVVLASAMFSAGAMAQSAKFAAVWDDGANIITSVACEDTETMDVSYCDDLGLTGGTAVGMEMATIKVPQSKELLVGISAQIELFTETSVKGKKGTTSTATAGADASVELFACNGVCYKGQPGQVMLAGRDQTLEATLGGVIETCTTTDIDVTLTEGYVSSVNSVTWDLDDCEVEDEAIRFALTTMAAHHFNFVFPNLPQGDYQVIARFSTAARATADVTCGTEMDFCDVTEGGAGGAAYVIIGKRMMTVQEVRAVKDEGGTAVEIEM
jgi:hypothetical protein